MKWKGKKEWKEKEYLYKEEKKKYFINIVFLTKKADHLYLCLNAYFYKKSKRNILLEIFLLDKFLNKNDFPNFYLLYICI